MFEDKKYFSIAKYQFAVYYFEKILKHAGT